MTHLEFNYFCEGVIAEFLLSSPLSPLVSMQRAYSPAPEYIPSCRSDQARELFNTMSGVHARDPLPGDLVQRFSWELEVRQRTEAETAEYDQLRSDLLAERERRASEKNREIERLADMFNARRRVDHQTLHVFHPDNLQVGRRPCFQQGEAAAPGIHGKVPSSCAWDAG